MNGEDEHEIWLSGWEQQCCEAIQNQPAYEQSLAAENEYFQRRVWTSFQDSATAIAQLYRGGFCIILNYKAFFYRKKERAFIFSFT